MDSKGLLKCSNDRKELRREMVDYINSLYYHEVLDYDEYRNLFDTMDDLLDRMYELGKKEINKE